MDTRIAKHEIMKRIILEKMNHPDRLESKFFEACTKHYYPRHPELDYNGYPRFSMHWKELKEDDYTSEYAGYAHALKNISFDLSDMDAAHISNADVYITDCASAYVSGNSKEFMTGFLAAYKDIIKIFYDLAIFDEDPQEARSQMHYILDMLAVVEYGGKNFLKRAAERGAFA